MGDLSNIPVNFADWVPLLESKVHGACKGDKYINMGTTFGRQLFDEIQNPTASSRLAAVMSGANSLNHYLISRWYAIFLLIIAIIVLISALVSSSLINRNVRGKFTLWTNGLFPPVLRRKQAILITGGERGRLFFLSFILAAFAICGCVLQFFTAAQVIGALEAVQCNTWQTFRTHYQGPLGVDRSNFNQIPSLWLGTNEMQKTLSSLEMETVPGEDNPIGVFMREHLVDLQIKANAQNRTMIENLSKVWDIVELYNQEIKALNELYPSSNWTWNGLKKGFGMQLAVKDIFARKAYVFANEVDSSLVESYKEIRGLISKYTNATSELMNEAHKAVKISQITINAIDKALGRMVTLWKSKESQIRDAFLSAVAIGLIAAILSLMSVVLVVVACWHLGWFLRTKEEAPNVTFWKSAYIISCVALGLCAFAGAYQLLLAVIGRDACDVINDDILENGRWSLLGNDFLHPEDGNEVVDLTTVMNTCVRRDGSGAIGATIGLSDPISKVASMIDDSINTIDAVTKKLMKEDAREIRVLTLKFMIEELLRSITHSNWIDKVGTGALAAQNRGRPTFNELANLSFQTHSSETEGRRVLLSLIALWNSSALVALTKNGLFTTVGSMRDGYDFVNKLAKEYHSSTDKPVFPAGFCGALAVEQNQPCKSIPNYVDLYKASTQDIATYVKDLDDILPSYGVYQTQIANRTLLLLESLRFMEHFGRAESQTEYFKTYKNCTKPADKNTCTFNSIRTSDIANFDSVAATLVDDYYEMIRLVHNYVDNIVKPKLHDIVSRATNLVESSNCQVEGASLDYAVYQPLCASALPGLLTGAGSLLFIIIVIYFSAVFVWLWTHFVLAHSENDDDDPLITRQERV